MLATAYLKFFFHIYLKLNTFFYSFLLILTTIAIEYLSGNWERLVSWKRRSLGMISRERIYVFSWRAIMLYGMVLQFSPRIIFLFEIPWAHLTDTYCMYTYIFLLNRTHFTSLYFANYNLLFVFPPLIDWFLSLQFCFFDFYAV